MDEKPRSTFVRFSLKWLFLGTAYAAIAAAAFGQRSWPCAELLWTLTILVFCYAILCAVFCREERRASWIGFALLWIAYVSCLLVAPQRVPSRRVLTLAGYEAPSHPEKEEVYRSLIRGLQADSRRNQPAHRAEYESLQATYEMALGQTPEVHAVNAVGTLVAGIIGWMLAIVVFREAIKRSGVI